jgi:hypothetical protein
MNLRYRVELSQTERAELTALLSGGKHAARKLKRAQVLLAADAGTGAVHPPSSVRRFHLPAQDHSPFGARLAAPRGCDRDLRQF